MATQAESSVLLPQPQVQRIATPYRRGIVAGLYGAAAIALWFFAIDTSLRRPLYTPTVLGMALFQRGAGLEQLATVKPSIQMTLMFSVVHCTVFIVLGIAVARLLVERRPNLWMSILLLFVVVQFGFLAFGMRFAALTVDALGMQQVVIGNVLAAIAMAGYLWWHAPAAATTSQS